LALDLGFYVERLLAAPDAPRAACFHEVAYLREQGGIYPGAGQLVELAFNVQGLLAAPGAVRVARLQHLPDLLDPDGRVAAGGLRRAAIHRQTALPDLVIGPPGAREREHGEQRADADYTPEHDPERVLHVNSVAAPELFEPRLLRYRSRKNWLTD
jgi:hypothetical protein